MRLLRSTRERAGAFVLLASVVALGACEPVGAAGGLGIDDSGKGAALHASDAGADATAVAPGGTDVALAPDGLADVGSAQPGADAVVAPLWTDPHEGEPSGAAPLFELDPSDIFAFPFPTDARRGADGHLDLRGFPNPNQVPVLDTYVDFAEQNLDGFAASGAIYVRFSAPIDTTRLPTPQQSTADDATVWLVDVTQGSEEYGRRIPFEWSWHATESSTYLPENLLAVRPVFGFPLREGATYALVVMRTLRDGGGALLAAPAPLREALLGESDGLDARITGSLAPLRAFMGSGALNPYEVSVATVFTVCTVTKDLIAIRKAISELPVPTPGGVHQIKDGNGYTVYEGTYPAPGFLFGEKPYELEGGGFHFDAEGRPLVAETEKLRFALSVPDGEAPPEGWPIVLFGHGTGGNYKDFLSGGNAPAKVLAARGIAVIGIDQPLHGTRWDGDQSKLDILSFNFINLEAGRAGFRQSAIDFFTLTRVARESLGVPAGVSHTGADIAFDPSRVYYFGHSHGGLAGAMIVALEPDLRGAILSGSGGGLAQTLMLRKEPYDLLGVIETMLGTLPGELSTFHPVITLVQNLVEVTDPLNYAPYFTNGRLRGGAPMDLLVTEGKQDQATPHVTTEAMAAAAGMPVMSPPVAINLGLEMANAALVALPVSNNAVSDDGGIASVLLAQYDGYDHYVVFDNPDTVALYAHMMETAAYGELTEFDLRP